MCKVNFKAKVSYASKNSKDNYYMVGFANDKYNVDNYILFQKPITLKKDDDPEAELNDLYAECNGDQCYNQVKRGTITNEILEVEVSDSLITIDITDIKLDKRTMTYIKEIFGDLLDIKLTK
ncbi:Imm10 family immunity protein [Bacteroides thetaiotaomicron]|uniref:Imm10 family immunity protein n=1 Tax=Bacteroides thetaiotaomicron TaxID=818 RepID=UPI00321BCA46